MRARIVTVWFVAAVAACSGSEPFEGECKRDSDCAAYQRCDTMNFRCVCASDEACAQDEYCNASGSCQKKTACLSNSDCPPQSVCDIYTGECIASTACTADVHCDIGQICEEGRCRVGCRETADCELAKLEVCIDGQCRQGFCDSNPYCPEGQVCNPENHVCGQPDEPHCQSGCSPNCADCGEDTTVGPCGDVRNVCASQPNGDFCWVWCTDDLECPSGYQCVPTTVSWSPVCTTDSDCANAPDPDDRVVNVCDGTNGGTQLGHCRLNKQPCWQDADCHPFETHCVEGRCVFAYHCRPPGGCR